MKLIDVTLLGRLDCEHLATGGSLIWDGLRFPREIVLGEARYRYRAGMDASARLLLSHARIGAALLARDLTAEVALSIDLGGARAVTLDDEGFPAGWGVGRAKQGEFCALNLDGFVYDRFGHLPPGDGNGFGITLSAFGRWATVTRRGHSAAWAIRLARRLMHEQRAHVQQRLVWVRRQQRKANEFHPQPYRHLAKVLRAQGHYHAAREVAIMEQWVTPASNWVSRLLRPIWGVCFGFGLSPVRATATVVVLLAIGTGGVWWAWKHAHVLTINYAYAMTEVADGPKFPEGRTGAGDERRAAVRQARHPAAVLRDGHDAAGDGAAAGEQMFGRFAAGHGGLAGAVGGVFAGWQACDVAGVADLLGCAEAEGGCLTQRRRTYVAPSAEDRVRSWRCQDRRHGPIVAPRGGSCG